MDHVIDNRKTFMDVHQALDWISALSEAESDGGEVSGLSDVSWVDSASAGSLFHVPCTGTSLIYLSLYNSIIYHCALKISAF